MRTMAASGDGLSIGTEGASAVAEPASGAPAQPVLLAPQLVDHVSVRPGRGLMPVLSAHVGAVPATFCKWTMRKGALVPLHHHANEQITWITEGRAEVFSQGQRYVMTAGTLLIIPPNVPHEFLFTEDTIDIDIFTPQRQDWLDGTAGYYAR
jgi:quercetin dioxygenase-like cupin family protein